MESWFISCALVLFVSVCFAWGGVRRDRDWRLVAYSRLALALVLVSTAASFYLIHSAASDEEGPPVFVFIILGAWGLLNLAAVYEVVRCKLWFDDETIYFQPSFGRRKKMAIEDVESCVRSTLGYYLIRSQDGDKIEMSCYMAGADQFAEHLKNR